MESFVLNQLQWVDSIPTENGLYLSIKKSVEGVYAVYQLAPPSGEESPINFKFEAGYYPQIELVHVHNNAADSTSWKTYHHVDTLKEDRLWALLKRIELV